MIGSKMRTDGRGYGPQEMVLFECTRRCQTYGKVICPPKYIKRNRFRGKEEE